MPVYVDEPIYQLGRMKMCHMLADTEQELHAMADKIGVARKHYQTPPRASTPHYDICKSKRALAIAYGAIPVVDRAKLVDIMRAARKWATNV